MEHFVLFSLYHSNKIYTDSFLNIRKENKYKDIFKTQKDVSQQSIYPRIPDNRAEL